MWLAVTISVAKVCLKFLNNTDKEQELTNIKMPNVKPNKGYLFVKEKQPANSNFLYRFTIKRK